MQPQGLKYRKPHKITKEGFKPKEDNLYFGDYGLMSKENGYIEEKQLESARKAIANYMKRKGKLWIRVITDRPITRKPAEVRMGQGKGDVDHYAAIIRKGAFIFELGGVTREVAEEAFKRAMHKLPLRLKFIAKENV